MLGIVLTILYVIVCTFLILVVLLQTGKRADLAGAFGGGGSQTAFGARGAATLLAKVTTACAVLFMVIALSLSILSTKRAGNAGTVLDEIPDTTPAPTAPAPSDPTLGFGDPATSESESLPADPVEPGEDLPGDGTETETEGEAPAEDPQP
jgi:preprotein translocase subunit SecG